MNPIQYFTGILQKYWRGTLQITEYQPATENNSKNINTTNPFTNHKGICWTVSVAYMFADKDKMDEAEFVMKDKDENCHYARIASNIVKLFYAGKKI